MTALTADEVDLLLEDYCDMEIGGHTTVSYPAGTQWVNVNAEFASRGLTPMVDYVLQGTDAAYDGVVSFSMSRLTEREPGLKKVKVKAPPKKRGAPDKFETILEDSIVDMLTGKADTLKMSSSWLGDKRQEAYATAALVVATLSGNA